MSSREPRKLGTYAVPYVHSMIGLYFGHRQIDLVLSEYTLSLSKEEEMLFFSVTSLSSRAERVLDEHLMLDSGISEKEAFEGKKNDDDRKSRCSSASPPLHSDLSQRKKSVFFPALHFRDGRE